MKVQIERVTDGYKILDEGGNKEICFFNTLKELKEFMKQEDMEEV